MAKAVSVPLSDARRGEVRLALRDALARIGKALSAGDLRKALPKPYQVPAAAAKALLEELVDRGEAFALGPAKSRKYAARDPEQVASDAVLATVRDGPLTAAEIAKRVKTAAPGFDAAVKTALGALVARGAVKKHPKHPKARSERFGLEPPDPAPYLGKAVKEMRAALTRLSPAGVTADAAIAALARELGVDAAPWRPGDPGAAKQDAPWAEAKVAAALRELASREPPGALLSIRSLRALAALDKAAFDEAVLRLASSGRVVLHHHDFAAGLPETEREQLVRDARGTHYVGIAPKRPPPGAPATPAAERRSP